MKRKRAHVILPGDLLRDVDALVGPRGRSAFLTEVIREAVNRRRLLQMLNDPEPILKTQDYPEFREGSDAWVRRLRDEDLRIEREKLGGWVGGAGGEEQCSGAKPRRRSRDERAVGDMSMLVRASHWLWPIL